ncbi:LOW QUALITY PROTEIN: hypothetical protein OSB04_005458 [Centaurea solstitialis]|uniref:Uncharacterized protein n=1 Tax=Centaurea solstitialis TaxID=347529 RepID=A0AA38TNP6_9ASTR|nr:LOW QUALITY PROTEIN: hypothetical protein OSB04_005458 [Centaurea solstitialis]
MFLEDLSGFSTDRQVEFEFDVILGSAPLQRLLIVWRHLGSKSYRVATRRRRSSARVASFGVRHLRVVRKKNGSHRMCSGNRKLNKVTIRSRYLLPRNGDLFDQFQEAAWFRHQLQVKVEDIHKAAFRAKCGHCEFLARPFGLAAAQLHWRIYEPVKHGMDAYSYEVVVCYNNWGWKKLGTVGYVEVELWSRLISNRHSRFAAELCKVLILTPPKGVKEMKEYCDASPFSLGGVVTWRGRKLTGDNSTWSKILTARSFTIRARPM